MAAVAAALAEARMPSIDRMHTAGRISQFSYIRVISCFAVVLLHCINTARVYYDDGLSIDGRTAVLKACSLLMWAVPCFLMVTGALLLDPAKEIPLSRLFGKYIRRVLTALLVFTFVFTLIKYLSGDTQGSSGFIDFYITNLLKDQAMPHLWYLYLMIVLYLLMPLFRLLSDRLSDPALSVMTATVALAAGILTFADVPFTLPFGLSPTVIIYPAYLFIGYLLFRNNAGFHSALAVLVISSLLIALFTCRAAALQEDSFAISSYSSPLVVLQASSVYSLLLRYRADAGPLISSLDTCTFGIYLIHMIFVRLTMRELGFDPFIFGPFAFLPMAVLFFGASYAVTRLIKRFTGTAIV